MELNKDIDLSTSNYGTARRLHYDMALIPWGATEPHNQHLPYLTDAILSHDVAVDAARKALDTFGLRCMVMPPVPLGAQNPGQRDLNFCIHYRYDTQRAVLTDMLTSLRHQGLKRVLIINGHGGNSFKNMIRDLAVDMPDMLVATSEWFKLAPAKDYFEQPDDHADELETSVMMHYHPELVNLSEAGDGHHGGFRSKSLASGKAWVPRNWLRVSDDTGIGDPRKATAEKGKRFADAVTTAYAELIRDLCEPDLYLPVE